MANAVFCRWSDNVLAGVDPTMPAGALLASSYPLSNLTDGVPATLCRLSTTTVRWVWDLATAKKIDFVTIGQHNIDEGHTGVLWQGHTSDAWGAPSLSTAFAFGAREADGYRPNAWIDLTGIGSRTFRYWSLVVSSANSQAVSVGEVIASGTKRVATPNLSWGMKEAESIPKIEHRTPKGVRFVYRHGVRVRRVAGNVDSFDVEANAIKEWYRDSDGRQFVWIPDGDVNDAMIVTFAMEAIEVERMFLNRNNIALAFEEWSRGVPVG